jgi:hypothetical protein
LRIGHKRCGWTIAMDGNLFASRSFEMGISKNGRARRTTQFQYTLQDPDLNELNRCAPNVFDKLKTLHELLPISRPEAWH